MSKQKEIFESSPSNNDQTTLNNGYLEGKNSEKLKLKLDQKLSILIKNKFSEYFSAGLILFYTCLVILRIALDSDISDKTWQLNVVELTILSLFFFEIMIKLIVLKDLYLFSVFNLIEFGIILTS